MIGGAVGSFFTKTGGVIGWGTFLISMIAALLTSMFDRSLVCPVMTGVFLVCIAIHSVIAWRRSTSLITASDEFDSTLGTLLRLSLEEQYSCGQIIYKAAAEVAESHRREIVAALKDGKMSQEHIGMDILISVLSDQLASGQFHVYRGQLSKTGRDMQSLYLSIFTNCVSKGYCDQAVADEKIAAISKEIESVG